jgi:hypothetical protein
MSAVEVIEQIKDLPPEEQAEVAEFVNGREASSREGRNKVGIVARKEQ